MRCNWTGKNGNRHWGFAAAACLSLALPAGADDRTQPQNAQPQSQPANQQPNQQPNTSPQASQQSGPAGQQANPQQQQANPQQANRQNQPSNQQQQSGNPAQQGQSQAGDQHQQKAQARELKVFTLQHRKPEEIQQLLALQSRGSGQQIFRQAAFAAQGRPQQGDSAQAQSQPVATAADNDSNTLFVRGTAEQIQHIDQIIKAIDVPAEQLKQQTIGSTRVIPIAHDHANRVRTTLSSLQLPHQIVPMGDMSLVVISNDGSEDFEAAAKQTEEVLSALQKNGDQGEKNSQQNQRNGGQQNQTEQNQNRQNQNQAQQGQNQQNPNQAQQEGQNQQRPNR